MHVAIAISILFILCGLALWICTPKTINDIYGYRTKHSMQSQDAWDYANKLSGKCFFFSGVISLLLVLYTSKYIIDVLNTAIVCLIGIISQIFVEYRVRKKF